MTKGKIIIGAILACLLWSTAFAGIKIGLQYNSPLQFAGIRFFISGLLILPFAGPVRLYWKTVWKHFGVLNLLALSQTFLNYALFYTGVALVPAALSAIIIGAQPLVIALLAHWLMGSTDRMTRRRWFSIAIGITGVIMVSLGRQKLQLAGGNEIVGVILLMAVNFTSGFSNILVSKNASRIAPFMLSSYSLMTGGLGLFLVSIPLEGFHTGPFPSEYWISLGWLSFMSAAAFSLWYKLLHIPGTSVSDLNLWKFIIPVFGAILSWILIQGESPDPLTVLGMIVISTSLIGFYIRVKK